MIIDEVLAQAKKENRSVLTEIEAKQILAEAGINCTDTRLAPTKEKASAISEEIGYPVVLKVSSVDITHKSDAGGVKVNLKNKEEVENAFDEIMASCKKVQPNADIEGISVQGMAKPGLEIIMGMIKDDNFGPVVMFGLGGVYVEVLKDVVFRFAPLTHQEAQDMIQEIKSYKVLQGVRGEKPRDVYALVDTLVKISRMASEWESVVDQLDINPLVVLPNQQGVKVLDALIIKR